MKTIQESEIKPGFYKFGNKGTVWNNNVHIAKSGDSTTLCGTPMLSTNWARIWEHKEIACQECLIKYDSYGKD